MPSIEKNVSKPWYHPTIVTKTGKQLVNAKLPRESSDLTELELLTLVSGSKAFAREFLETNKSILELTELEKPRELLVFPSATSGVIARVWAALELFARVQESQVIAS